MCPACHHTQAASHASRLLLLNSHAHLQASALTPPLALTTHPHTVIQACCLVKEGHTKEGSQKQGIGTQAVPSLRARMSASVVSALGAAARAAGRAFENAGKLLEVTPYVEHLAPSTKVLSHAGKSPAIHETVFVAPSASIIGHVQVGKGSSVWYGATLRGDVHSITVGEQTTIGDRAIVHVAKLRGDAPTKIGSRVNIGARAVIHACTLEDESTVGAGAQVLDKAVVKTHAALAPGAVLTPGKTVPSGQLWAGVPAKFVRELTAEEIANIKREAVASFELATVHKAETTKDYLQVMEDEAAWKDKQQRSPDYWPRLKGDAIRDPAEIPGFGVPGRIFNHPLTTPLPEGSDGRPQGGEREK